MNIGEKTANLKQEMWKNKNEQYLFELQKFLDLADNIEDVEFRKLIISQMLKCEKSITNVAEEMYKKILRATKNKTEE